MTIEEFRQTNTVRYLVNHSHTEFRGKNSLLHFSNGFFEVIMPFDIRDRGIDSQSHFNVFISFIGGKDMMLTVKDDSSTLDNILKLFEKIVGISKLKMEDFSFDDFFPIYIGKPQKIKTKDGVGFIYQKDGVYTYVELCQNKVLLSRILNNKIFEDSWDFKKYDSLTNVVGDVINKIIEEDMKELNSVAVYQFVGYEPIFGF